VKAKNKAAFAAYLQRTAGITVDPQSLFDVQVKRIHEYKRQLLFAFYIVAEYLKVKNNPSAFVQPRTFFVGGKAAPAYFMAKLSIKFVNAIAEVINRDRAVKGKLRVVFLENYRVSLAEKVFPASDLSEQISTAGTEASGTGNMKFMLNGALTIGTLDGANIEIARAVGPENIFIFGLKEAEVERLRREGYRPRDVIDASPALKEVLHLVASNFFSPYHQGLFDPILDSVYNADPFLICADFDAYCRMQETVSRAYQDRDDWAGRSIINVAKSGPFSSDRAIYEYARDIWKI
jgi:starch phosphorylase